MFYILSLCTFVIQNKKSQDYVDNATIIDMQFYNW